MKLMRWAEKKKLKFVLEQLQKNNIYNTDNIIDVGSGTGWLTKSLISGYNVTCFDKNGLADITGDILTYQFRKKYKVVLALEFLEHGFFTEKVINLIEPNGYLIATFPNPKLDGLMRLLAWNNIVNGKFKYEYLEHINLFEPEEIPLKIIEKESLFWICNMVCYKKVEQ